MSSWKKAAKAGQKYYRERHQPASRQHLGLLEKKKDYKERANDHEAKEKAIKLLRKRALNKNPDEFYFHMVNSCTKNGIHHDIEKDDEHTPEQLKLMQTQDLAYITMKRTMEMKRIEAAQSKLHLLDIANKTPNSHIFFVDSEKEAREFDLVKKLETHPALVANRINRMKIKDLEGRQLEDIDKKTIKLLKTKKKKMYSELSKRIDREKELSVIQNKLEIKKHLSNSRAVGVHPKKVKAATRNRSAIYKWNYDRKR